jgi:hypothetical protein
MLHLKSAKRINVFIEITLTLILALVSVLVFNGSPSGKMHFNTNGLDLFLKSFYFLLFFVLLFSISRTISLRKLFIFFYIGVLLNIVIIFLQYIILPLHIPDSPLLGLWSDKNSIYHLSISGPILEDSFKFLPLLVYYLIVRKKKTLKSFSISDWILMGLAVGLGAGFGEDLMRISRDFGHVFEDKFNWFWPSHWYDFLWPTTARDGYFFFFNKLLPFMSYDHSTATAAMGLAFGLALHQTEKKNLKSKLVWALIPFTLFWAMMIHGLGNLPTDPNYFYLFPIMKHWIVKYLMIIFLGGWSFFLFLILGMAGVWIYEFKITQRKKNPGFKENLRTDFNFAKNFFFYMLKNIDTSHLKSTFAKICYRLVAYIASFNALLEFIKSKFTMARVRHALIWKDRRSFNKIKKL